MCVRASESVSFCVFVAFDGVEKKSQMLLYKNLNKWNLYIMLLMEICNIRWWDARVFYGRKNKSLRVSIPMELCFCSCGLFWTRIPSVTPQHVVRSTWLVINQHPFNVHIMVQFGLCISPNSTGTAVNFLGQLPGRASVYPYELARIHFQLALRKFKLADY